MTAVHLGMMELKRDGECSLEPPLAIFAPHHHRVVELVSILVHDAVKLCMNHSRGPYYHAVLQERASTRSRGLRCERLVCLDECGNICGEWDVAGIDTSLTVVYDDVDCHGVELVQLAFVGKEIEFLYLRCSFSNTPAKEGIEFNAQLLACL